MGMGWGVVWEAGTAICVPGTWPQEGEKGEWERSPQDPEAPAWLQMEIPGGAKPPKRKGPDLCQGLVWACEEALAETTHFLTFHSNVIRMGI